MTAIKNTKQRRRKTGIPVLGDVPWGTHVCQFYKTKQDLIDILVPYFKTGLENREFCVWVASEPLGAKEAEEALQKSVSDLEEYVRSGQIEILSHGEWYLKEGAFDPRRVLKACVDKLNKALADGYTGIRVTGNTTWVNKKLWGDFVDYEKEVNEAIRQHKMIVICSYSLHDCGIFEVIQVSNNHQFTLIKHGRRWQLVKDDERKRAEKRLFDYQARLKSLASKLSLTREHEKHNIAVRVHDQIGQTLVLSKMKLEALSKSMSSKELCEELAGVCELLRTTIGELRSLIIEINSPVLHELGFEAGVADLLAEQIENKHKIECQFEDDGQVKHLSDDTGVILFRNVRELLSNVLNHAHAHTVKVSIRKVASQIHITVNDDGVGFDPSDVAQRESIKRGFGHLSIREGLEELGGRLEIDSKPGHGCRVTMTAPLKS